MSGVDVLAVLDEAHRLILGVHTKQSIEAEKFSEARAAVAEILEALREVLAEVDDCGLPDDMDDAWDFIPKVRAALANATGEPK